MCSKVQSALSDLDIMKKKDQSPVTVADFASPAVITLMLLQSFPGTPIVGEEDTSTLKCNEYLRRKIHELVKEHVSTSEESRIKEAFDYEGGKADCVKRFWTVDPIDGTKGFLRGQQYAIALALVEKGQVVLGVLGCPNFPFIDGSSEKEKGCIFSAVKSEGAYVQKTEESKNHMVHVDNLLDLSKVRFCESVEKDHISHEIHAKISSGLGITSPPYRIDSQCKYAAVARGDASIYLRMPKSGDYRESIWDHAAGAIIVEEAGGEVTDFHGNSLDFSVGRKLLNNVGVMATNGSLHKKVLEAIAQVV